MVNPTGPATGTKKVIRGNISGNEPRNLRASIRGWAQPDYVTYIGFRVALDTRARPALEVAPEVP
jgi:formylglycine-generating enzyme required for sulfatase activity